MLENAAQPGFDGVRRPAAEHPVEQVGERLRGRMPQRRCQPAGRQLEELTRPLSLH
jgi:hypothetical protein